MGDEEWLCDDDGKCDPAPDKVADTAIFQGSVLERQQRLDDYTMHCGEQPNDCYHHVLARDLTPWIEGIQRVCC